jgi:hypothetical protein
MTVEINYGGRFGNHVFQYGCARLFAIDQGLKLFTDFPRQDHEILSTSPPHDGAAYKEPTSVLRDGDQIFGRRFPPGRYVFSGFFQNAAWYHERRKELERIFHPAPITNKNTEDIVVHIRLGDYRCFKWVIHPKWYLDVLERESFQRLYIVSDERNEGYLAHFNKHNPIFIAGPPAQHWNFLRSFDRIVSSNSTFCWWACFFSEATRIYTFKRWIDHPNVVLSAFPGAIPVDGIFTHEV